MEQLLASIALSLIDDLGPQRYKNLINTFGSAKDVYNADFAELLLVDKITRPIARRIHSKETLNDAQKELEAAQKNGIAILSQDDERYPYGLKNISDPPIILYVSGQIKPQDFFSVAIVGSRRATHYGISAAKKFSEEFASLGVTTVSGLARGIDTEVHKVTLQSGGRTIAVLGNGLEYYYPPENRALQKKIGENGAVISEFPLEAKPDPGSFPRRNRIISAISAATLVVEADENSGALITARYASEQGKDVFAVPGNIFSKYSKGPHSLIKQGAKLVESSSDIIEEIAPLAELLSHRRSSIDRDNVDKRLALNYNENEKKIVELLQLYIDGASVETVVQKTGLILSDALESLLQLELKGAIKSLPGKQYILT